MRAGYRDGRLALNMQIAAGGTGAFRRLDCLSDIGLAGSMRNAVARWAYRSLLNQDVRIAFSLSPFAYCYGR